MTNNSKVTEIRQKLLVARALKTESNRLGKLISILDAQFSLAEQMEFKLN